jgi:hypothetical protein
MEKDALLGEVARLLASDVTLPGGKETPRLLMRKRSPGELASIQHTVNSAGGLKPKIEGVLHRAADKTFTPRVAGALKSVASLGVQHPEIIPMQAAPIPGLTPAYLAGKRGLEKLIERVSPVPKIAFAVSQYSYPLNPSIPSQASSAPGFLAPNLQSAVQKRKQAVSKEWVSDAVFNAARHGASPKRLEDFAGEQLAHSSKKLLKGHLMQRFLGRAVPQEVKRTAGNRAVAGLAGLSAAAVKQAAGAPTRGNFYMSSDIPSFNPPDLKSPIQKRSGFDGKDQPNEGLQKMSDGTNRLSGLDEPNQPVNKVGGFKREGDAVIETDKKGKSLGKGNVLEKDSDMLPDYVTYNQGDFKRSKYAMPTEEMAAFVAQLKLAASGNSIMGVSPTLGGATSVAKAVGAPKLSGPGPSIAQQVKPKGPHFGTGIAGAFKGSIGGRAPQDLS